MFPIFKAVPLVLTLVSDSSFTVPEFTVAPVPTRAEIKAARDKFELEMKLDTRRPWDRPSPQRQK